MYQHDIPSYIPPYGLSSPEGMYSPYGPVGQIIDATSEIGSTIGSQAISPYPPFWGWNIIEGLAYPTFTAPGQPPPGAIEAMLAQQNYVSQSSSALNYTPVLDEAEIQKQAQANIEAQAREAALVQDIKAILEAEPFQPDVAYKRLLTRYAADLVERYGNILERLPIRAAGLAIIDIFYRVEGEAPAGLAMKYALFRRVKAEVEAMLALNNGDIQNTIEYISGRFLQIYAEEELFSNGEFMGAALLMMF